MKLIKKSKRAILLSLLMSICMITNMTTTVFATDVIDENPTNSDLPIEVIGRDFEFTPLPEPMVNPELTANTIGLTKETPSVSIGMDDVEHFKMGRATTQTFEGTIPDVGGMSYAEVSLAAGESLYATLECPLNEALNYDLFLFEFNLATGELMPEATDASVLETYFNTYTDMSRKTCDEGVMTSNNSSETKVFAVIVIATSGSSAIDPFYLTVSTANSAGAYEPNENIFTAPEAPYGDIAVPSAIDTVNDQDWYLVSIPNTLNYRNMNIFAYDANADVYVYDNGKLILQKVTDRGYYRVNAGQLIVVCVTGNVGEYTFKTYPVDMIPYKAYVQYESANLLNLSEWRTYNQGSHYTFWGTDLKVRVGLATVSGYAFEGAADINVKWWSEGNFNSDTIKAYLLHDESGWTSQAVFDRVTSAIGVDDYLYSTNPRSRHYYDYDEITVTAKTHGGDLRHTENIYHFAYSETSV